MPATVAATVRAATMLPLQHKTVLAMLQQAQDHGRAHSSVGMAGNEQLLHHAGSSALLLKCQASKQSQRKFRAA